MQTLRSPMCIEASKKTFTKATAMLASALVLSLSVSAHAQDTGTTRVPAAAPVEAPPPSPPVQGPSPDAPPGAPDATGTVPPEALQQVPPAIEQAPAPVVEDVAPVEPVEAAAPPAEPPSHAASYALWTASGVSLVLGTVFGVLALKSKQDFNDAPSYKRADEAHDRAIIADVGLGLGVILAVTGTVFYFSRGDDAEKNAKLAPRQRSLADVRVAPFVQRSASGGTLSLSF